MRSDRVNRSMKLPKGTRPVLPKKEMQEHIAVVARNKKYALVSLDLMVRFV